MPKNTGKGSRSAASSPDSRRFQKAKENGGDFRKQSVIREFFSRAFWREVFSDQKVWGLGIKINEPVKTVVRQEDYPRMREGLAKAAEYHRNHPRL